jgi:hypothetical protein
MILIAGKEKESIDNYPFHLLHKVYQLHQLGQRHGSKHIPIGRGKIFVYNIWKWCGETMPFSAQELFVLYDDHYCMSPIRFKVVSSLSETFKINIDHFRHRIDTHS